MKTAIRILCSVLFLLHTACLMGQIVVEDTATDGPFFSAKKFDSKAYVGFETHAAQIMKNQAAALMGLSLNWVVNHKYVLSAKYHTLASQNNMSPLLFPGSTARRNMIHHFAGLGFGYLLFHDKKVSLHPELTAGWASVKYNTGGDSFKRSDYAMIVPAVYAVWNATPIFRIGAGVNYRAAFGRKLYEFNSSALGGAGGVVFFRVGKF